MACICFDCNISLKDCPKEKAQKEVESLKKAIAFAAEELAFLRKENKRVSWQLDQAIKRAVGHCKEIKTLKKKLDVATKSCWKGKDGA